jgi:HAD superfamily 5'-nucleotidase-like hydrolase
MSLSSHTPPPERRLFCNRTLNLRGIRAVGFDMDYTLVHYHSAQWEERAYEDMRQKLVARGVRAEGLSFDHELVRPGLVLDLTLGNAVKPNRFGFVKQACHGTANLSIEALRDAYSRVLIDLQEPRWVFLNTLFSLSEACLFLQLVDRFDRGQLADIKTYDALYQAVRECMDATHAEGELKAKIIKDPDPYVDLDPDLALALLDLKHAGKKLLLITNSEWSYTHAMMTYTLDRFLPKGQTFRDVFDLIITGARKPRFFESDLPVFRVIDDTRDVLQPHVGELTAGQVYFGGHARLVERCFNLRGEDILYVGDHLYADVHVSKNVLRWRTCLITRELENELSALESFKPKQAALTTLMEQKDALEHDYSMARIALQRRDAGYGPTVEASGRALKQEMQAIRQRLIALDQEAAVLAKEASELGSKRWGLAMRAGNDKSRWAYQMERYADVYTSRVSNFALASPFVYLRSPRGSLPHDAGPSGGT